MLKISREVAHGRNKITLTTEDDQKILIEILTIDLKRINGKTGQVMMPSVKLGIDAPQDIKIKWSTPDED
jgi:sRNA-binding carbon storage regulator CsrA